MDAGYKVATRKKSAYDDYFRGSKEGTAMHKLYQKILDEPDKLYYQKPKMVNILDVSTDTLTFDSTFWYMTKPQYADNILLTNFEGKLASDIA